MSKFYIRICTVLSIALLSLSSNIFGQSAQTINPEGGYTLGDGLKIVVNTDGQLAVYRNDQTQYYYGYPYSDVAHRSSGVTLLFRFSSGSTYNMGQAPFAVCSTTPAIQEGNVWTTSMSGYVISTISSKRFFVTINFKYTYPQSYFTVDYIVRAPADLPNPELVHMYLSHDAYVLGSDAAMSYRMVNSTGEYVGDYRDNGISGCTNARGKNPTSTSGHGFKTSGSFRSYFSGDYSVRDGINSQLRLTNTLNTTCIDDGVAVEFTVGPLSSSQSSGRQIMHGYGNSKTEFDNVVVTDPIISGSSSLPVTVNFSSAQFSEPEGNSSHTASSLKVVVSDGVILEPQICNFTIEGGNAVQNTDYSFVAGFIIPAGDYRTAKTLTLDNFTILGNTIACQGNRTVNIQIQEGSLCNDLVQRGTTYNTTLTIVEDDANLVAGTISDPSRICSGSTVILTATASTGGGGTYTYQWQSSPDNSTWTNVASSNSQNLTTANLTNSTYYRRQTTDASCGTVTSNVVLVSVSPTEMYWSSNAVNSNWNNPANWANAAGVSVNAVPASCSNVHIPGNAAYYPSLDATNTPRATYGDPVCNNITYHFGAEVAKPHYLTYSKAYIQYNFGYYDNNFNYKMDGDAHSATPMKRGQWYALSAPLKKVVTGDFSVGGYPNMWQHAFQRSNTTIGGFSGQWYEPDTDNALEIGSNQAYAVSIWAGEYLPGVLGESEKYHSNMNTLKGILEMPYFENPTVSAAHRIHEYDGTTSTFKYYKALVDDFPFSYNEPGSIVRGSEAYKFIFDGSLPNTVVNDGNGNQTLPTFKITVPAGKEIMIGNPFISNLDFRKFYELNSSKIDAFYRLYVNSGWQAYSYSAGAAQLDGYIAPLQAFFISTLGASGSVDLFFPPELVSTTRPASKLKSSVEEPFEDVVYVNAQSESGSSMVTIALSDPTSKNVPVLFTEDYPESPQIFTTDKLWEKNAVIYTSGYDVTVPIGIWCQGSESVKLSFSNLENIHAESLILIDKAKNKGVDLLKNNSYTFENVANIAVQDRFELQIGSNRAFTAIDNTEAGKINIYTSDKTLYVKSNENISEVNISSTQGIKVISESCNVTEYVKELHVSTGVYIVTVKTQQGDTATKKIVIR